MINRKNIGYTIVETLIAFAIVAVLTILAISYLRSEKFNNKTLKTNAHKVIDDISSVSQKIIFDDSVDGSLSKIYIKDTQKVCRGKNAYINDNDCQKNIVSLYAANLEVYKEPSVSLNTLIKEYGIDKSETSFGAIELPNRAILIFFPSETSLFKIFVDVNGRKEPNVRNEDIFWLYLISTGVDLKQSDWPKTNI